MKKLLPLWLALTGLLLPTVQGQNLRYYVEKNSAGQKRYYIESGAASGIFVSTPSLSAYSLTPKSVPIAKPVNRNYAEANATLDFGLYPKAQNEWPDGFKTTLFYRRTDIDLATQLRYTGYMVHRALSESEWADPALKPRTYWDITANILGPLQSAPALIDASLSTVLGQFNTQFNPASLGAGRLVQNFETVYFPPNITKWNNPGAAIEDQGVLQFFADAETHTWVCESASLKGQTLTLRQLFDQGKFAEECRQRTVNRFVAINRFYQAKCGPNTQVLNGDGNQVYVNGSVAFDDRYATTQAATGTGSTYNPEFWYLPANYDPVSVGGVSVTSGNLTYWQTQAYLNNYSYKGEAYVSPADFDYITSLPAGAYRQYWPRLKMGVTREDVNRPASFLLNRAKLIQAGMPEKAVVQQSHNRLEFRVKCDDGREAAMTNLGPDMRLQPPWMLEMDWIVIRMVASKPGDGYTLWTTVPRGGPGVSAEQNTWSDRPLDERMAIYTAQERMRVYLEYFTPSKNPVVFGPDAMYVRYTGGISGANWAGTSTPVITAGGDGYFRRGAAMIVNHENRSDLRSKTGVLARVVQKNGALWALIVATNPDLPDGQYSTFDVRFKAADVGTTADLDVTGLRVGGKETMVTEVCLQPHLLTDLVSTTTTPGTTTTAVASYSKVLVVGNSILAHAPLASIGWSRNNGMAASTPENDFLHLVSAKIGQTNPSAQILQQQSGGFELNFRSYNPATDNNLNSGLSGAKLIILRFGENVNDGDVSDGVFAQKLSAYIDYCRANAPPDTPILLSTSCWNHPNSSAIVRTVAGQKGCLLVDLADMWTGDNDTANPYYAFGRFSDYGVAKHPSDAGHAEIARRIVAKIPGVTPMPAAREVPFEPVATDASGWGSADMLVLENGQVRVGLRRSVGAQICRLIDPRYNEPLVNDYKVIRNGVSESDKGRQFQFSFYGTPGQQYIQAGQNTNQTGNDVGWNPVFGGNRNSDQSANWNAPGTVVKYERRTVNGIDWVYTLTRTPHWSLPVSAGLAEADLEQWIGLDGRAVRYVVRGTIRRTDTQMAYNGREQEMPCAYVTAAQYRHFVWQGNSTLAASAMTDITLAEPAGAELAGDARHISIPYVLALNNSNRGLAHYMPGINRTRNRQFYSRFGNEDSNEASYIAAAPMQECDENGKFVVSGAFVVGTDTELRAWYDAQPPLASGFDYQFTATNRQFWWSLDGAFRNVGGVPTMNFAQPNFDGCRVCGMLSSPIRTFQASAAPTIYIKGAFTGVSQMRLTFNKPGLESTADAGGVDFAVTGDGLVRTYAISMAGMSAYSGLISRIKITHAASTTSGQLSGGATFKPIRISSNPIP